MTIDRDRDLRDLFARMKEEDRVSAPPFAAVRAAAVHQRTARRRWTHVAAAGAAGAAGAAVAAILVAMLSLSEHRRTVAERERARLEVRQRVFAGTAWRSPTDFLLNTATSELLGTVPTFGAVRWIDTSFTHSHTRQRS